MNFMKDWNEIVEYVEGFSSDIMTFIKCDNDDEYANLFIEISRMVAYYTLMIKK